MERGTAERAERAEQPDSVLSAISARYCLLNPTDTLRDHRFVVHFRHKFGPWWKRVSDHCHMFPLEHTSEGGIVGVHPTIVTVDIDCRAIRAYLRHPSCELDLGID